MTLRGVGVVEGGRRRGDDGFVWSGGVFRGALGGEGVSGCWNGWLGDGVLGSGRLWIYRRRAIAAPLALLIKHPVPASNAVLLHAFP